MIENLGVLTPRPDWANGITETLSWMTSVTESPLAVEQRMGLRLSPRQMFEINFTLFGAPRTYFDLLVMQMAGSPFYLPLWHDTNRTTGLITPGMQTIPVDTTLSELSDCRLAVLLGDDPLDHEIVEVMSRTATALTLVSGLAGTWPAGARILPVKKVRVETQPSGSRFADRAYQARTRFLSLEPNTSSASATLGKFMGNYVLEEEPNEIEALAHSYDRKMFTLDEQVGLQLMSDVAGFVNQAYSWFAKGRAAQRRLRGLFYALQGRRVPIWIPSYFADFDLALPIGATDTVITVKRCGYTDAGGPFKNRQYILIQLTGGKSANPTRFYCKIAAAAINVAGDRELLDIVDPLGVYVPVESVLRISFISFCRLDQDAVEFVHHTDTRGLTTVNSVFRTDPGIGQHENGEGVPPVPPRPQPPPIFDPFRIPDQVLVGYAPSGSLGVAEPPAPDPTTYAFVAMQHSLTQEEVGFPNDLIVPNVGSNEFSIPLTGSFRVSWQCFFEFDFGIPETVKFRVAFFNTTLTPVETIIHISDIADPQITHVAGDVYRLVAPLVTPITNRILISAVASDPLLPITIQAQYITAGWVADTGGPILGMNVYAISNVEGDPIPYAEGDAFMKIEWWS